MGILEELKNNELTVEDLKAWDNDFKEVEEIFETVKNKDLQGIIDRFHRIGIDITSDTHEPLEYIDFNYGSLTCTISTYNEDNKPELLTDDIEGYIRRDGTELCGFYNVNIEEVRKILKDLT